MNNLDKIYLLNHKPFFQRLENIEKRLKEEGIYYQLVQNFEPEEIDYEKELKDWEKFPDIIIEQINGNENVAFANYRNFSKKISINSLSLVLKHLWCMRDQIKNNYENVIIIEDDCQVINGFYEYLYNNIKDFIELKKEKDVEMLMIGTSHGIKSPNITPGKYAHYSKYQKCRCTHCYLVNISATKKIIKNFYPINLPIDFKLNEIIQIENIKVAWSEPGLFQ